MFDFENHRSKSTMKAISNLPEWKKYYGIFCGWDSDTSFESDTDDEIDTTEIEEEDWIEHIKRSTDEAIDEMEDAKIRCWIKTHKRMKWRMALRIASLPNKRWMVKAEWKLELSSRYKTIRAIGRPRRRWEDDINEFLKLKETETENSTESGNKSWIKAAKDRGRWFLLEKDYTRTAEDLKIMRDTEGIIKADQQDMSTE